MRCRPGGSTARRRGLRGTGVDRARACRRRQADLAYRGREEPDRHAGPEDDLDGYQRPGPRPTAPRMMRPVLPPSTGRGARTPASKDIALLVLRHEVAVLWRRTRAARVDRADRAVLAAAIRCLSPSLSTPHVPGASHEVPEPQHRRRSGHRQRIRDSGTPIARPRRPPPHPPITRACGRSHCATVDIGTENPCRRPRRDRKSPCARSLLRPPELRSL